MSLPATPYAIRIGQSVLDMESTLSFLEKRRTSFSNFGFVYSNFFILVLRFPFSICCPSSIIHPSSSSIQHLISNHEPRATGHETWIVHFAQFAQGGNKNVLKNRLFLRRFCHFLQVFANFCYFFPTSADFWMCPQSNLTPLQKNTYKNLTQMPQKLTHSLFLPILKQGVKI